MKKEENRLGGGSVDGCGTPAHLQKPDDEIPPDDPEVLVKQEEDQRSTTEVEDEVEELEGRELSLKGLYIYCVVYYYMMTMPLM